MCITFTSIKDRTKNCPSNVRQLKKFVYLCTHNTNEIIQSMISIIARKTSVESVCMLTVYIKNRPLEINTYISLKLKIPTKEWNAVVQLPKRAADERPVADLNGMSYAELTGKLLSIKKELSALEDCQKLTLSDAKESVRRIMNEEIIKEFEKIEEKSQEEKCKTLMGWIREFINDCESGQRLKRKSSKMITPGTVKSYKGTLAQLEEYEKARYKRLDFDDMTMTFYEDWKRFFIEKKYSPNTIGRHVRNLKIFLYAADEMKYTTTQEFKSPRFSADREDVDNVYITTERLRAMADLDLMDYQEMKRRAGVYAKNEEEKKKLQHGLRREIYRRNLAEARDIFLLGCLTGQRVSDYKRINRDMIVTLRNDRQFLHLIQAKTGKDIYVPYQDMMGDILDRYEGQLPKIQDQHLNERIKVVGLLLGWTESAGLQERRGVMTYQSGKRFCDAIMTHTARRTFATNAYKEGISLSSIMAVTGHGSEQMLRKYLKLDNKERAILAAEEFDRKKKAE